MKLLIILFFSQLSVAQVLLIPDQNIDFEKYKSRCLKEGYICTMTSHLEQVQQMDTPRFNEFLNQLDYSSESFKAVFISTFFTILKEESLSVDQIEILLKMIDQLKEFSDSQRQKQFSFLARQMNELLTLIKNSELTELPESYMIILKKPVPVAFLKHLKPEYFKVKIYESRFNRVLNTADYLVEGSCEGVFVHPSIQNKKWQIESEKVCGLSAHFLKAKESTTTFIGQHKTGLITTGLILVGAALLMKNYEVQFTF